MNPEYLQKYEDEMREKQRAANAQAAREDAEAEIHRLRQENADLKAKLQAACPHSWLGGYCDMCGAIQK